MKNTLKIWVAIAAALCLPLTSFASEMQIGIAFENETVKVGENLFEIYGKTGSEAQSITVVENYSKNGQFKRTKLGNSYELPADTEFSIEASFEVKNGETVELFLNDGEENPLSLSSKYGYSSVLFEYELFSACTTSAGVYNENGSLVRTLWSAKEETEGKKSGVWDGKDDFGNFMNDGSYKVKVLSSNVSYEIEGLIGNNSEIESLYSNMSNYYPISDMAYANGKMYYAEQYTEARTMWRRFDVDNPHEVSGYITGQNKTSVRCATDGETVYWLNFQPLSVTNNGEEMPMMFVAGLDIASNMEKVFEEGTPLWRSKIGNPVKRFESAVGLEQYDEYKAVYGNGDGMTAWNKFASESFFGDIAVTSENPYLAVTFPRRNYVKIMNKYTGEVLCENSVDNPTMLSYDNLGRLWVVSGNSSELSCYEISQSGVMTKVQTAPQEVLKGEILGMELSPSGQTMALVIGGEVNKLMTFDVSSWSLKQTFGSGESYEQDPTVKPDKLLFRGEWNGLCYSYVAFEDENTLWFGDCGNRRNFKLDLSGDVPIETDNIIMRCVEYHLSVDCNNPKRVFSGHFEYEIDYQKPVDECWELKYNRMFQTRPYLGVLSTGSFIDNVTTAENGRTYFVGADLESGEKYVYELSNDGVRNTGINVSGGEMMLDGKLTLIYKKYTVADNQKVMGLFKRYVVGFEGNNPIYGDEVFVGYVSADDLKDYSLEYLPDVRSDGFAVFVDRRGNQNSSVKDNERLTMRLAAVTLKDSYEDFEWAWKIAPETPLNYIGSFPRDGAFETNSWHTTKYGPRIYGSNVIMQYHGEGYKGGQTNIFYHFRENGLLVGVFGNASYEQEEYDDYGQALVNGNGFTWQLVTLPNDNSTAYIYQAGESGLSGALRTKVTGLDTISEQEIPLEYKSGLSEGAVLSECNSEDFVETDAKICVVDGFSCDVDSAFAKIEGYIEKPKDAAEKFRLYFITDGQAEVCLDKEALMSGEKCGASYVTMKSDRKYFVSAEVKGRTFKLLYEKADGSFADFPMENVYNASGYNRIKMKSLNLLESIPYSSSDKEMLPAWNFSEDSEAVVSVKTNEYSYAANEDNSLSIKGTTKQGQAYEVSRDMGEMRSFAEIWELDAEMMYLGHPTGQYYKDEAARAGYFENYLDILDENNKIIARFYVSAEDYSPYGNGEKIKTLEIPKDYTMLDSRYKHELAEPFKLNIVGEGDKITFTFNNRSITTKAFENGANVAKPKTFRISAAQTSNFSASSNWVFKKLRINQYALDYVKTVSFYDENKELLTQKRVRKNSAVLPPSYEKEGFDTIWNKELLCVNSNIEVYASLIPDKTPHTVEFCNENGEVISEEKVLYGGEINIPNAEKSGYKLSWTKKDGTGVDFSKITEDITVYAKYERLRTLSNDFSSVEIIAPLYDQEGKKVKSGSISSLPDMSFYANDQAYKVLSKEDDCLLMEGRNIEKYSPNDFRIYFDKFQSGEVSVGFRFKALNYMAATNSNCAFGSLFDNNGRCVAKLAASGYGLYSYDGKIASALLTKDTKMWHEVLYVVSLENRKFKLMFDGELVGEYDFYDKEADSVASLYFEGASTGVASTNGMDWYLSEVYAKNE